MTSTGILDIARSRRTAKVAAGEHGRLLRELFGLSQADVAQAVGVKQSTVSLWEGSQRRPRGRNAQRYGQMLLELERELEAQGQHP